MNINVETALKTIVSTVVPEEEAPQSEHRPESKVQAQLTPLSFVSRMTVDVIYKMYMNKVLMELKFLRMRKSSSASSCVLIVPLWN